MSEKSTSLGLLLGTSRISHAAYAAGPREPWIQGKLKVLHQAGGHGLCMCRPSDPRRLVVRRLPSGFYLAAWPSDGSSHAFNCRFHTDGHGSDLEAGTTAPVQTASDGGLLVSTRFLETPASPASPESAEGIPLEHGTWTLGGLLHLLWAEARLNCWAPTWRRDYWRVWREVDLAATRLRTSQHATLSEHLFMPEPFRRDSQPRLRQAWNAFRAAVHGRSLGGPGIVLGELKSIDRGELGATLLLRHLAEPIYITQEVLASVDRAAGRAIAALGSAIANESRVMVLATVETAEGGGFLKATRASALLCNSLWLPALSSYELRLADALVDQGRAFVKPLHLVEDRRVLPDFVLQDTEPPTALEILSIEAVRYRQSKMEKSRRLQREGLNVVFWDAYGSSVIPALPAPVHW